MKRQWKYANGITLVSLRVTSAGRLFSFLHCDDFVVSDSFHIKVNQVNQVLDHAVERELANSKSVGTNLQAEQIFLTTIRADVPTLSESEFSKKVRSQVKKTLGKECS